MSTRSVLTGGLMVMLAAMFTLGACARAPQPTPAAATQPAASPAGTPVSFSGAWEGSIDVANQKIGIIVRFSGSGADLKAQLDIPAQGAKDLPLSKLTYNAPRLSFEAFGGQRNAVFDGELKADGSIAGTFTQAGYKGAFTLMPSQAAAQVTAPPTIAVPYRQEEVTLKNGAVTLAGTLTLPEGAGASPAVILITGSGPQNRDEDIFGFQPFRMIADHFTRQGIATLRLDDRGIGGSTGDFDQATTEDFAGDITAAYAYLKTRGEVNPRQIGLLGHSEGGLIAPMVANRVGDAAFVVLMAGPGVSGAQILERQVVDVALSNGVSQVDADKAAASQRIANQAIISGQGLDEVRAMLREQVKAQFAALTADQRKAMGDEAQAVEAATEAQIQTLTSPWFRFFLSYDPSPALSKLRMPVLALFGGKDVQVAAAPNEVAIRAALAAGGNNRLTVKVYPNANHLFQPATTGAPSEYTTLKSFVPGFVEETAAWILSAIKG